jgi:hypothetical protein
MIISIRPTPTIGAPKLNTTGLWCDDHSARSGAREQGLRVPKLKDSSVIIVSEPSAEVARRVRTGRSAPVRSRSSAAYNDTPRYADARPISVHTEVLTGISVPSGVPGIVLRRLADIRAPHGVAAAMAQAPPLTPASRRRGGRV